MGPGAVEDPQRGVACCDQARRLLHHALKDTFERGFGSHGNAHLDELPKAHLLPGGSGLGHGGRFFHSDALVADRGALGNRRWQRSSERSQRHNQIRSTRLVSPSGTGRGPVDLPS
jgi:hypothetical protein